MKQIDKDFEVSENAYKKIFKNFPNPLYIWKKVGKDLILIDFNDAGFKITQGGIERYRGIKASELYKQNPKILEDLNNCFNQKTSFYKKVRYKFKSTNKTKTLLVYFNYIPSDLVLIYTQDKTAEEEAELALKNSEREKALVLESISEIISFQDLNHNIIWMNRPATKLLGLNKDDLIGKKCYEVWYNKENECLDCPVEKCLQTKKVEESEIKTVDGEIWSIKVFPVKDEQQKIIGFVEVAHNITEKKKAKQALKESEQNFQTAYNRAEFYKDIFAHDINNILQNIRSASDLLEIYQNNKENPKNIQEMIDIIKSQVVRGANLVSNIRKLSLLDNIDISLKKLSVKDTLFKAVSSIKDIYSEKQIEVNIKLPENDFKVFANEFLLDVFENILYNAIEFNDNDVVKIDIIISKIYIKEKPFIEMQFIDNGIGIKDDRKEKIFERSFIQKEQGKGMGLGLSLVRKILEAYHATIKVENKIKDDYTKGSNFRILFPTKV